MPMLPYSLARAVLFNLDAEKAHDITLDSLQRLQNTPLACLYSTPLVNDPVTVAGVKFPNRVGLAAGLDKNARCIDALGAMGFGFVEVGTVTPLPQPGNAKPRMFRIPERHALINRLGFNNDGLQAFVDNVQRARFRKQGRVLGLNIGKNAATPIEQANEDYVKGLRGVYAHADYVTINISSPNTKNLRDLQSDAALDALLGQLSEAREQLTVLHRRSVPLFVKIAPDVDDEQLSVIVQTLRRYGSDAAGQPNQAWGVIATNTTLSRAAVQGLPHADEAGGLSGAPVLEASNAVVRKLRAGLGPGFPIIGVGGILSAQDAVSKIDAGADVVQIYTGLIYNGPSLVRDSAIAIRDHLAGKA
ncbi:dihydroorotate oxidase A [Comamonas sp. BIGb0124]|uniref:quinone-dependent dihydroorotate dehydrogenase n=1 Tax=Comamonas sp. BIGb0124 TaxID=2485130 RepID=UPI000F46C49B|nr:quinone-dependent dihydroorotate dehydrogenase [Comamonas sp. BIGb0124]ROR25058.1 dihydroorotate oxidase A [Comamonas sp. BIGb0124]